MRKSLQWTGIGFLALITAFIWLMVLAPRHSQTSYEVDEYGCGLTESDVSYEAKKHILNSLNHPATANFKEMTVAAMDKAACSFSVFGTVTAENDYLVMTDWEFSVDMRYSLDYQQWIVDPVLVIDKR